MLSVTNAMCSASSMKGETRNRAHLFKSSIDYKERKEKENSVSFQAPMATYLHSLAYIPSPCFFRKDLQIYPIHFCRPLQPSIRLRGFKPLYGSWSGSQEFQSLWISVPHRSFWQLNKDERSESLESACTVRLGSACLSTSQSHIIVKPRD